MKDIVESVETSDIVGSDGAESLIEGIFGLSPSVRYVAVRRGRDVVLREREGLGEASSSESDRYEELLVNPTLLTLARERGEIDCGGLRFLVVGYGNFHQLVVPTDGGHVSIAFQLDAEPLDALDAVLDLIAKYG
jgi:hypothetical protein